MTIGTMWASKKLHTRLHTRCRLLQKDLDNLLMWAEEWQLMFIVSKCKVMHLGHKNHGYSYYMDTKQLDIVEEEKDSDYQRLESISAM